MNKKNVSTSIIAGVLLAVFALTSFAEDQFSFWDDRISIGGEIRGRSEFKNNFYTRDGLSGLEDEFFLLRSRLHTDIHPYESWRVYLQAQDSREFGSDIFNRHAVPNPVEDDLDLYQGFLELDHLFNAPVSLRVGRQILSYGNQRLIGAFNWSNVSRSFDAVKVMTELEDMGTIDFFVGQPVVHDWGQFNTSDDGRPSVGDDSTLYGIYSSWNHIPYVDFLEAYYLLRDNNNAQDEVHTLGIRSGRTYDSGWDWTMELAGQVGDFGGQDHSAFAYHGDFGYTFDYACSPRAGLGYSYASGDSDPSDNEHNTFDNLYPTNHLHYGSMDLFSWRNVHDLEANISAHPLEDLLTVLAVHAFWLVEPEDDAWRNAGGGIVRFAAAGADSYVGTEIDLKARYKVCNNFSVEGGYSHFFAGEFVDDTGDDDDADWGYIQLVMTF